jgi:hypothetical protein
MSEKTFYAVKFMREQREKLSEILSKMTKEEINEYFKKIAMENPRWRSVFCLKKKSLVPASYLSCAVQQCRITLLVGLEQAGNE